MGGRICSASGGGRGLGVWGVCVGFEGTMAVDGISLEVGPGEILGLLGPSGSGKTTLLRAVAGLESLDAGAVTWDGVSLDGVPVHRRAFGIVFQDKQLFAHMDVARNVAYGLKAQAKRQNDDVGGPPGAGGRRGKNRLGQRARVEELLDLVGLEGFGAREVETLSGGEQQRVALARALAPRPRLLLLDEPFSALDTELRVRLADEVGRILRAEQATAIVVTHDQDEAFAVADRIALLDQGRLQDIGAPQRLWSWPASTKAARILGCRWFLPARLEQAGELLLHTPWGSVSLPAPPPRGSVVQSGGSAPAFAPTPGGGVPQSGGSAPAFATPPGNPPGGDVVIGLRPGALTIGTDRAEAASAIVRLQSGELRANVEIDGLGAVEVRVDPGVPLGRPAILDPARIAVIRSADPHSSLRCDAWGLGLCEPEG